MIPAPLLECFRYRDLFYALVERDLKLRFRGSALGILWTLANPLFQMGVYTLVFSVIIKTRIPDYPVFLLSALLPWTWLSTSLLVATDSIVLSRHLIKKIYFPSELVPLVAVTTNLIIFLCALPVLAVFLVVAHHPVGLTWLALPAVIAIQFLCTTALALALAMLNAFYRDIPYLLNMGLTLWLYLTPVLYPSSFVPAWLAPYMALNPMLGLLDAYRAIFLEGRWPNPAGLLISFLLSLTLLGLVYPLYLRRKYDFAEVL